MALAIVAATATAATALGAYLDVRLKISSDARLLSSVIGSAMQMKSLGKQSKISNYTFLENHAITRPDHVFLIYEGYPWTYLAFYKAVNRVGNYLLNDLGLKRGDTIVLDFENSPEYVMLTLATDALGLVPGFINCNLSENALEHCVKICDASVLLLQPSVSHLVDTVALELEKSGVKIIQFEYSKIPENYEKISDDIRKELKLEDVAGLTFTSGTTGLPKAAMGGRGRYVGVSIGVAKYLRLKPEDVFYTCMPLYHAAARSLCLTPVVYAGCTLVLGRTFSHKTFWPTVVAHKVTHLQYVGELLRYLVTAPPGPMDKAHSVQMAWGNGCRPDVWHEFQKRFGIETIVELYAATDGMGTTFNINHGGPFGRGAIGTFGFMWNALVGRKYLLAKVDADGVLERGPDGFCIKCGPNEPGELLTRLDEANMQEFKGYKNNPAAKEKRIVKDLFKQGDMYFRSGDLLRIDKDGSWYFVDRLGDTFRWKSENVSTNEVADVLGGHPSVSEVNVYGIQLPHHDGRCGCAAIVVKPHGPMLDMREFAQHGLTNLPRYAVPVFLRVVVDMPTTGTLKMQKVQMRDDGADPERLLDGEKLFWLKGDEYVPFTQPEWRALCGGGVRL